MTRGVDCYGCIALPVDVYDQLRQMLLESNLSENLDAGRLFELSFSRNVGEIIRVRNYAGIIALPGCVQIEVLPRIALHCPEGTETNDRVRQIFLRMIATYLKVDPLVFNNAHVKTSRATIFEALIDILIDETYRIITKDINRGYVTVESNENVYKGKILFQKQIKHNLVHQNRLYVEHDTFNSNRPENRLIKTTLIMLKNLQISTKTKVKIEKVLAHFEEVDESTNTKNDFDQIQHSRQMKDYGRALVICRVFLSGQTLTSVQGRVQSLSLLFPMEKVFEAYIAREISRHLPTKYSINVQDCSYSLFDSPRTFGLIPDIVVRSENDSPIVLDTKWKVPAVNKTNRGIATSDMYQMYAYGKKYNAKKVFLLYPLNNPLEQFSDSYISDDGVKVFTRFLDLENVEHSVSALIDEF